MPYFCASKLMKRYETTVFQNLSFSIPYGTLLLLAGRNGSGKSSLLRILAGLDHPDTGKVYSSDQTLLRQDKATPQRPAPRAIYHSQDIVLFEEFSVRDNLAIFASAEQASKGRKSGIVRALDLKPLLRKRISALSGGQKRRVHLAATLLAEADFYLLDEADAGVDPVWIRRMEVLIQDMKAAGKGFVCATHNAQFLRSVADFALSLDDFAPGAEAGRETADLPRV